jgi:hypothetical protein
MDDFLRAARSFLTRPDDFLSETIDYTIQVYHGEGGSLSVSYKLPTYNYGYYRSADGNHTRERVSKNKYKFGKRDVATLQTEGFVIDTIGHFKDKWAEREILNGLPVRDE